MNLLYQTLKTFNDFIWGFPIIFLLVGIGIYLTFRLEFIQFRKFIYVLKCIIFPQEELNADGDVSSYNALFIALASTVGTGNIIGVALAISLGGPGAIFWMWITGLLGMATKFAECMLAVKYRTKDHLGHIAGGPMYYLEKGVKNLFLAKSFAILAILASLTMNCPQSKTIVDILALKFRISPFIGALGIGFIVAYITFGGVFRISRIAGIIIPFVATLFILGSGSIILFNYQLIPSVLKTIFVSAFDFKSATGGFLGSAFASAINQGVRRGIFSNEQGNGSSPIAAATAITNSPVRQGLINMMDVFIDTHIINVQMGILIIMTGSYKYTSNTLELVTISFSQVTSLFSIGEITLIISLIFFSFTTIIAWNYYGERCSYYLFGEKSIPVYKVIFVIAVIIGGILSIDIVFQIADAAIALMIIPNAIGILYLSPEVIRDTKEYFSKK